MAFDSKGLDDYVDVAQRIADFRQQYPHGSLQPLDPAHPWEQAVVNGVSKDGKPYAMTMIVYVAAAYRTPEDPRPGIGVAWEPFPGRTPYTLGSELMNAETSAWGRAIIAALASDSKRGVSSREEVRNRAAEREPEPPPKATPAVNGNPLPDPKRRAIFAQFNELGIKDADVQRDTLAGILGRPVDSRKGLTAADGDKVLTELRKRPRPAKEAVTAS